MLWSIGVFATRSEQGSTNAHGNSLSIFQIGSHRQRDQLSESGKTLKLQLTRSLMLGAKSV
jgi:hypothetical protein